MADHLFVKNPFFKKLDGVELVCKEFVPVLRSPGIYDKDGNLLVEWANLLYDPNDQTIEGRDKRASACYRIDSYSDYSGYGASKVIGTNYDRVVYPDTTSWHTFVLGPIPNTNKYVISGSPIAAKEIQIPDNYVALTSYGVFGGNELLESVVLGKDLINMGTRAFANCKNLKNVYMPDDISLQEIDYGMFEYCESLEYIKLPNSIKKLTGRAFGSCYGLKEIILPEGLLSIGAINEGYGGVFEDCTALEEIRIPDGVTYIHPDTFKWCTNLKTIYYDGTAFENYPWSATNAVVMTKNGVYTPPEDPKPYNVQLGANEYGIGAFSEDVLANGWSGRNGYMRLYTISEYTGKVERVGSNGLGYYSSSKTIRLFIDGEEVTIASFPNVDGIGYSSFKTFTFNGTYKGVSRTFTVCTMEEDPYTGGYYAGIKYV